MTTELAFRDYVADLLQKVNASIRYPGQYQPLWLCMREDIREEYLAEADRQFGIWRDHELAMEAKREERYNLTKGENE